MKRPDVAGNLKPGVGRDVLRVLADEGTQVPEQTRLDRPVQLSKGVFVALAGTVNRRRQVIQRASQLGASTSQGFNVGSSGNVTQTRENPGGAASVRRTR